MKAGVYSVVPLGTSLSMPGLSWCLVPNVDSLDVAAVTVGSGSKGTSGGQGPALGLRARYIYHFV